MRHWNDRLLPLAIALALAVFFWFGLLWPLSHSMSEAVREPAVTEAARAGESLAKLAERVGVPENRIRALNDLSSLAPDEPLKPGTILTVRAPQWTGAHVAGLFDSEAPQWRWILNSLLLAAGVTALCMLIAFPLAYLQARTSFWGKALLGGMLLLPLVLPPFVGAIGLRRMLSRYGTVNLVLMKLGLVSEASPIDFLGEHRMLGIVAVMVLHFYPLLYLNLVAAISNIDPSLLESARNLGSSPARIFRRVILPLSIPGLVAGGSLVFVGAFTDLGTPLIFSYQEVVAQQIYSMANEQSSNPAAPALVAVVTLIVLLLFASTRLLLSRYGGGGGGAKGASRAADRPLRGLRAAGAVGLHLAIIALALLPHLSVLLAGLAGKWFLTPLPESWTLSHIEEALGHTIAQTGVRNSLFYATVSTALDILLGLACAWIIVRRGGWWSRALDALTLAPLAIPGIVLAFGYVGTYGAGTIVPDWMHGIPGLDSMLSSGRILWPVGLLLVLSYATRRLPYTTRACCAGLEQTPKSLEEAGGALGAPPLSVLAKITVPLIAANVAAGAILAFSFAMLEVSDSMILANRPQDFPLTKAIFYLFGRVGDGDQLASALGLFALLFMALSLLAAGAFMGRKWGEMFRS